MFKLRVQVQVLHPLGRGLRNGGDWELGYPELCKLQNEDRKPSEVASEQVSPVFVTLETQWAIVASCYRVWDLP